tara:strand:+ start:61 stop:228 length:168 start_codon:yes stop_codon:yes gene_type:complete
MKIKKLNKLIKKEVKKQLTLTNVVASLPKNKKKSPKKTIWDVKTEIVERNLGKMR